jgi:predicted ester cyclase
VELISKTIDEIVEPDALIHTRHCRLTRRGRKRSTKRGRCSFGSLPDVHITIEDVIAEGDTVVGRNSVTGTHQGDYVGLPPTGRSVTYNEIFILRFANGRIAETWGVVDVFSQMKLLGAIPA